MNNPISFEKCFVYLYYTNKYEYDRNIQNNVTF